MELPPIRDQSSRLSTLLQRKTDIYGIKIDAPETPSTTNVSEVESSGWNYWAREAMKAKGHGGDYDRRHHVALRASIASVSLFSSLILPEQSFFGGVWIGNIFMHTNLKDSFGSTFRSVKAFSKSIIITNGVSTPIAYFLSTLSTMHASIILPFLIFILSFIIMTCPQLASRNLMILCMYIAVAAPVRKEVEWWLPFGYIVTYIAGLSMALIVNCCNFALSKVDKLLSRQEKDLTMLLIEAKNYADHTGVSPEMARTAMATIEMLYSRIKTTTMALKAQLPAAETELGLRCGKKAAKDLKIWVQKSERLLTPLKDIRSSLSQRVIGEGYSAYSDSFKKVKTIIAREVGPSRDRMMDAMIASIAVCHAWANPRAQRTVLPDVERELEVSINECRSSFNRAMAVASEELKLSERTDTSIFAHLTRRMCAFNAIFGFADDLLEYLREHSWEFEDAFAVNEMRQNQANKSSLTSWLCRQLSSFVTFIELKWLWHNPDSLRLAIKTSLGMSVASLFMSVPYLWDISAPFGIWPGLTVASVNLALTGSSFAKAADRLFGTLLAAAFALLVTDLFPGSHADYVKMPAIGVFTYAVIYLRTADHAYKFTYAATSIGAMLYGSAKANLNILEYIPKRIELIFVGVVIFSFVELFLFPRSSRRLVESIALTCIFDVNEFLKQAVHCTRRMEDHIKQSSTAGWNKDIEKAFFDDAADPYHLERLASWHKKLKAETGKLKKELDSGLDEPNLGLTLVLDRQGYRELSQELKDCEIQALLLLKALQKVSGYYQKDDHPVRKVNWPGVHATFLQEISTKAIFSCEWIKSTFPDGRLRPQQGNNMKSIIATASFRQIEEVRLEIIDNWSKSYYLQAKEEISTSDSDPVAIMDIWITTTYILELSRHYQQVGKAMETIVHKFPSND